MLKAGYPLDAVSVDVLESALPCTSRRQRGKKGRTKTPAGLRWVELPPSIAVFYEELLDSHRHAFVLCTPEGAAWRRSGHLNVRPLLLVTEA